MKHAHVSAPGKALLGGEYAVLFGAPAVVCAVDRRVQAWWDRAHASGHSAFTVAALEEAAALLETLGNAHAGEVLQSGFLGVDSSALYQNHTKIGLGSSAAVTVATLGAALSAAGVDLAAIERGDLFAAAERAHARAQGAVGSGADLAASIWGGVFRFTRAAGDGPPEVVPLSLPRDLRLTFVFTGSAASTPQLVTRIRALFARAPELRQALHAGAEALAEAFAGDDAARVVKAADTYGGLMESLGRAADAPIVAGKHAELRQLAYQAGSAAKPSGAGGGDLAVCFSAGDDAALRLRAALSAAGIDLLPLSISASGLSKESP